MQEYTYRPVNNPFIIHYSALGRSQLEYLVYLQLFKIDANQMGSQAESNHHKSRKSDDMNKGKRNWGLNNRKRKARTSF